VTAAAVLLGALVAAAAPPVAPKAPTQQIAVEVRGPVALVEVTRPLEAEGVERLLDVTLPAHAGLVDVSVKGAGQWRALEVADGGKASQSYDAEVRATGYIPAREPFDEETTFRVRVARRAGAARGPMVLRYRYSVLPEIVGGRRRIRVPASSESTPLPADVRVSAPGARGLHDLTIAGATTRLGAATRAPARAAWEISWSVTAPPASGLYPTLAVDVASGPVTAAGVTVALSFEARSGKVSAPPTSVLLLIDRSRSVGPGGAAAERDLAKKLLEALPPSTRFDALLFDRGAARLFPAFRPATREALSALDPELLPDKLRNGTDLPAALRAAGDLLRREAANLGPRVLLAIISDGALPSGTASNGALFPNALGEVPGVDVRVAAWILRPLDDEPAPRSGVLALHKLVAHRLGLAREVRANELDEAVASALVTLARGGDVSDIDLVAKGDAQHVIDHLAPGESSSGVYDVPEVPAVAAGLGVTVAYAPRVSRVEGSWLTPLMGLTQPTRALLAPDLVAIVEPVERPTIIHAQPVRGALDRDVVRNTLALAFLPRARACYLNRSSATSFERDLAGRVKLEMDLTRGEVSRATIRDTTLASPTIESCLREGALELDVPRPLRSDFPVTAVLNLVFRPRTQEKRATPEEEKLGAQIDLVIEDLHKTQPPPPADSTPQHDRSMVPTR
jgi:hypothetical protein